MCWYASYKLGRMSVDMDPSTTMKCLLPFVLTPVTVLTRHEVVATMLRPGSMIIVRLSSLMLSLTVSISSLHAAPWLDDHCEGQLLDALSHCVDQLPACRGSSPLSLFVSASDSVAQA